MHTVYETHALKRFHHLSITASRRLIASPDMSHTNTLTNLRTITWLRSMKNVRHNIKILHRGVRQPLQQQPSLVKDKSEAPRVKRGDFPIRPFVRPSVLCTHFVLFIVAGGLSQHALGERQGRSVIYHRAMAVLCHSI